MIVIVFLAIILFFFASSVQATQIYDLSDTNNFNLRIDGQYSGDYVPDDAHHAVDLDSDGVNDFLIGSIASDYTANHTGFLFLINGTLLGDWEIGKTWDLQMPNNYDLRVYHPESKSYYPAGLAPVDFNNDGLMDILVTAEASLKTYIIFNEDLLNYEGVGNTKILTDMNPITFTGGSPRHAVSGDFDGDGLADLAIGAGIDNGGFYILFNETLNQFSSGSTVSLADSSNYDLLVKGPEFQYNFFASYSRTITVLDDIDGDGKDELAASSRGLENNNEGWSGSLYLFSGDFLSGYKGSGETITITDSTNYNIRIDGGGEVAFLGFGQENVSSGDFNGDGSRDLFFGQHGLENWTGSAYLMCNNLVADKLSSQGNIFEIRESSNYNIEFMGLDEEEDFGHQAKAADLNHDGIDDLAMMATMSMKPDPGELYIVYGDESICENSGVTLEMTDANNYDLKYVGPSGGALGLSNPLNFLDADKDGSTDILVGDIWSSPNSRYRSGAAYTILNFPHSLTIDSIAENSSENSFDLTGSVSASVSVTDISGVQYSLDSNSPLGSWTACSADDGAFDSKSENYTCSLNNIPDGVYTVYIRAFDDNMSYTPQANYGSISFTIDTTSPGIGSLVSVLTNDQATITWTTDEQSSTKIEYGLTNAYGHATDETDTDPRVVDHQVILSDLVTCTTYHYRIITTDVLDNITTGNDHSFTTTGCTGNASVSQTITSRISTSGGSLSLKDNQGKGIDLTVPANFSSQEAVFQIKKLHSSTTIASTSIPDDPDPNDDNNNNNELVNHHLYDLKSLSDNSTTIDSFDKDITITITYSQPDIEGLNTNTLSIYRWDGQSWQRLNTTIDSTNHVATATTRRFSVFAFFGQSQKQPTIFSRSLPPACQDPKPVSAPDLFQIDTTNTTADLFFTPIANTSTFYISFSQDPSAEEHGALVTLGREGVQNYTVYHLKPNTTYYFKIRGDIGCMPGDWSDTLKIKTTTSKIKTFYKYLLYPKTKTPHVL